MCGQWVPRLPGTLSTHLTPESLYWRFRFASQRALPIMDTTTQGHNNSDKTYKRHPQPDYNLPQHKEKPKRIFFNALKPLSMHNALPPLGFPSLRAGVLRPPGRATGAKKLHR